MHLHPNERRLMET